MPANITAGAPAIDMEQADTILTVNGAVSLIKNEPETRPESRGVSPGGPFEEDIYEDAGDLDFTNAAQQIYLTRIPKFLWKSWALLEADDEILLGTVRVEGDLQKPKRVILIRP